MKTKSCRFKLVCIVRPVPFHCLSKKFVSRSELTKPEYETRVSWTGINRIELASMNRFFMTRVPESSPECSNKNKLLLEKASPKQESSCDLSETIFFLHVVSTD